MRSAAVCRVDPHAGYQREQFNSITHYIDASNVYGSTVERADQLREFDDPYLKGNIKCGSCTVAEMLR